MALLVLAFLAGMLTVAAPCILPLLPIIIGGSLSGDESRRARLLRPIIVSLSLVFSVIIFTLLLRATTSLIGVPQMVWQVFSAALVIGLGLNFIFPKLWTWILSRFGLAESASKNLGLFVKKSGINGAVLTGFALGPVFNSCSPTYAYIVAVSLPASFVIGFSYLLAYALGLALTLLLIAYAGQAAIARLGWLSNPAGWFVKLLGVLFIAVGLFVLFGIDKKIQTFVLEKGWYDPISGIEEKLR